MTERIMSPKSIRRRKQLDELREFAAGEGHELDVSDKDNLKGFLLHVMRLAGLQPEIVQGNGQIRSKQIDANGYIRGTSMVRPDVRLMRTELIRIIRIHKRGGPWEPGDLDALEISNCARKILEACLGEGWRTRISMEISARYQSSMGFAKTYDKIDDRVGIKVSQGRILVQAALGTAYYRNGHLILSQVRIPAATLTGMIGREATKLMEGNPYGNAFEGVIVKHAECPEATTIIHLEETFEPASDEGDHE